MSDKIYLSVVIPAYNEVHNIKSGALKEVYDYLKAQDYSWEILIVDDGSTDDTALLASSFSQKHAGVRLMKEPHRGKGGTVIAGMLTAKGKYVLFTDMDQATPIDQIERFLPKFKEGYDVVIGSRAGREGAPLIRKLTAIGFALFRAVILRLPYKDTQAGFKAFKKEAAEAIFSKMKNLLEKREEGSSLSAGFDTEMLYLARKMKFRTAEVPIKWHYKEGTKKNIIKESWIGFKGVIAVRLKALMGYYKLK